MSSIRALIAAALLSAQLLTGALPFDEYPHIQCEACLGLADRIWKRMNETANETMSIQASHRLGPDNKTKRVEYRNSELHAVETMDGLCASLKHKYYLRINESRRFFTDENTLRRAPFYSKRDKEILGRPSEKLQTFCDQLSLEEDEEITEAIKESTSKEELEKSLCHKRLKLCENPKIESALKKEAKLREKYTKKREPILLERERLREEELQREKEEEEQKKKEEEEKKREEEELKAREQEEKEAEEAEGEIPVDAVATDGSAAPEDPSTDASENL